MSDLISRSELLKEIEKYKFGAISNDAEREYIKKTILDFIICQPTAYSVDGVVEGLEETMQDLSVIEILSHIDFDSTIQSGLDNFLKAYNSELLRIVKQGGVSDDVCEWKQTSTAKYKTSCGYKLEEYFDTKACYCKQCGKKIKIVGG